MLAVAGAVWEVRNSGATWSAQSSGISFPRGKRDPRPLNMSYSHIRSERVMEIDWRKTMTSGPEELLGKPVVKGTRLSVELVLGLFAEGWTERQVLEEYLNLTDADIRAIFAFATECMREESLYPLNSKAI